MTEKEKRELFRQLNIEFCELCKEGKDFSRIKYLIGAGADIFYSDSKPMYWAAKKKNFEVVELLLDAGALKDPRAILYIATICDYKNFNAEAEIKFFGVIDKAIEVNGRNLDLFVPYINSMIVHGKTDKLFTLADRYNLSRKEVVSSVYPRVIFETVNNGFYNSLEFINENIDWMNQQNLDNAVSSGETDVVKYIFDNSDIGLPSEPAILAAIFEGEREILELLVGRGWKPQNNPLYLKKACRSFYSNGASALLFLLENGYSISDGYEGKSIYENAVFDKNTPLINFLQNRI